MRIGGEKDFLFNSVGQTQGSQGTDPANKVTDSDKRAADVPLEEKVSLSDSGKEVLRALKAADSSPEVREEKIARLKAAIAEGRYQVDPEKVADSLLRDHLSTLL